MPSKTGECDNGGGTLGAILVELSPPSSSQGERKSIGEQSMGWALDFKDGTY